MNKYYANRIKKINKFCPVCAKPLTNPQAKGCRKHFSQETRDRMRLANLGKKMSDAAKEKCRISKLGKLNPFFGKKGPLNPAWKGGHPHNYDFYYRTDWKSLRTSIYKRDNWTCQTCGIHCGKKIIQCHHKIPYFASKDNSESNLITLCVSCHTRADNEYRRLHPVIQGKLF